MLKEKLLEMKEFCEQKRDYYEELISQKDGTMLTIYNILTEFIELIDKALLDDDLEILDLVKEKTYPATEWYFDCGAGVEDYSLDCIKLFVSERDNRFRTFKNWLGKEMKEE